MIENYLTILEESLKKKSNVLERIEEVNQAQAEILKEEIFQLEVYDSCVDEKDLYIEELGKLDEGFEALYEKIKQQLLQGKDQYAAQIKRLQSLIEEITDKSVTIQAQEARNKKALESYFAGERKDIGKVRKSSKAALDYYRSMNKTNTVGAYFMDKKK